MSFDLDDIMPAPWDVPVPKSMTFEKFKELWFIGFKSGYVPNEEENAECVEAHKAYEDFVKQQEQKPSQW